MRWVVVGVGEAGVGRWAGAGWVVGGRVGAESRWPFWASHGHRHVMGHVDPQPGGRRR